VAEGVIKASLTSTGLIYGIPTSSMYTSGSGMNLLSEACAAVSTTKFPGPTDRERTIQTGLRFGRRIPSPSKHDLLPLSERERMKRNGEYGRPKYATSLTIYFQPHFPVYMLE